MIARQPSRGAGLALILAALPLSGCGKYWLGQDHPFHEMPSEIHQLVERRLEEQQQERSPTQRWENQKRDRYQDPEDIATGLRAGSSQTRLERFEDRLASGMLDLVTCLELALASNDDVQAARAEIRAVGGQELVTRSRFLPRVEYLLDAEENEATEHGGRLSMTLLEFGRDNPQDVALRDQQRRALFAYENIVRTVLSDARRLFFTVLLRQQQIAERYKLLEDFQVRFERVRRLEEEERALDVDLLTARLNVLNEEARINRLEKEMLRAKMELLHVLGLPIDLTGLELEGGLELFELPVDQAVELALQRSTAIAQARAAVFEQQRLAQQIWWETGPRVDAQAGWRDENGRIGIDLRDQGGTYAVSGIAEVRERDEGTFLIGLPPQDEEDEWFASIQLSVPLITGLERTGLIRRERARLAAVRHQLRQTIDRVALEVRQSYQTLLEQRVQLQLQRETVAIARRRLEIQERLKDLGRISDDQLETFRTQFFSEQNQLLVEQLQLVQLQESLRAAMRYFEPLPEAAGPTVEAIEPLPEGEELLPEGVEPLPGDIEPAPEELELVPEDIEALPEEVEPMSEDLGILKKEEPTL